jgi:hypothetical protein
MYGMLTAMDQGVRLPDELCFAFFLNGQVTRKAVSNHKDFNVFVSLRIYQPQKKET